ncbi:hypothetical protein FGK63_02645 [Ruegeria sediminis]|uniref:Uncharacterized protein n=1 Tax=Ruegeria sediminis TaxID=2583820 RepID=A0ABY2X3M0_9RHOB|nr:hypothetical protein [Ruegeria sediminis]TMV09986.1 hypothetical protein FGK63_02645 [Ruegeria sediminis]
MLETREGKLAVKQFQKTTEAAHTAYQMANYGMGRTARELSRHQGIDPLAPFAIGPGEPGKTDQLVVLPTKLVIEGMQHNGLFSTLIATGLLAWIYSLWEEEYRYKISQAEDCKKNDVRCDLMNDLRLIRHWVLHDRMIADEKNHKKLKVLSWPSKSGEFAIGKAEMEELQRAINKMEVYKQPVSQKS